MSFEALKIAPIDCPATDLAAFLELAARLGIEAHDYVDDSTGNLVFETYRDNKVGLPFTKWEFDRLGKFISHGVCTK